MYKQTLITMFMLLFVASTSYGAYSFTDTLTLGDGELMGTGDYDNPLSSVEYLVEYNGGPYWDYQYTITVPETTLLQESAAGISHIIIETSVRADIKPDSLLSDPVNYIGEVEHGWHTALGSANPTMPSDMYGLKVGASETSDATTVTLSFSSTRAPMWGDFYIKAGSERNPHTLWNTGFGDNYYFDPDNPDIRPNKLLVPDTNPTPTVPAPGAFLLAGLGSGIVGYIRRRRSL